MKCLEKCKEAKSPCNKKDCRLWINYKKDLNCIQEAVAKHGPLTLREAAKYKFCPS